MQAAMQTSNSLFSFQAGMNTNASAGNRASSPMPSAHNGLRDLAGQMSNRPGSSSQTSISISSQCRSNGKRTAFSAQSTISNFSRAADQQPMRAAGSFDRVGYHSPAPASHCEPRTGNRYDNSNDNRGGTRSDHGSDNHARAADRTPPRNDCGCKDSGKTNEAQWSNTAVSNNQASVDLGDYKLDFNKSDSSMAMTNTKTGDKTEIWGDPHLTQHVTGSQTNSTSAMFNGPMTFQLPDSTKVTVTTQPDANNKSVSYADQVTITRGNQAYQVTGLSEKDKAGLSVQKSDNGRALDAATPDGFTLVANHSGNGWINPATGKAPTADDIKNANA